MSTAETLDFSSKEDTPASPVRIKADSELGLAVLAEIKRSPPLTVVGHGFSAPELDPRQNIAHLPDELVQRRLQKKLFRATDDLKDRPVEAVITATSADQPIEVPLDHVIDAQSFIDWMGRAPGVKKTRSTNEGYVTESSFDTIRHYASLSTKIPPISSMEMFVQPDGKVFFNNDDDGSHRLAAAVVKGQESVPAYSLRLRRLQEDIF